ncbi:hypothetical protein KKF73_04100 [Patescibacteria group bacterium]|nr:hypothetical protein [Patescibacteria group bacterium]
MPRKPEKLGDSTHNDPEIIGRRFELGEKEALSDSVFNPKIQDRINKTCAAIEGIAAKNPEHKEELIKLSQTVRIFMESDILCPQQNRRRRLAAWLKALVDKSSLPTSCAKGNIINDIFDAEDSIRQTGSILAAQEAVVRSVEDPFPKLEEGHEEELVVLARHVRVAFNSALVTPVNGEVDRIHQVQNLTLQHQPHLPFRFWATMPHNIKHIFEEQKGENLDVPDPSDGLFKVTHSPSDMFSGAHLAIDRLSMEEKMRSIAATLSRYAQFELKAIEGGQTGDDHDKKQQKVERALWCLERAKNFTAVEKDPEFIKSYIRTLYENGQRDKAVQLFWQSLPILEAHGGKEAAIDHLTHDIPLRIIEYCADRQPKLAKQLFLESLPILKMGDNYAQAVYHLGPVREFVLGDIQSHSGDPEAAKQIFFESLPILLTDPSELKKAYLKIPDMKDCLADRINEELEGEDADAEFIVGCFRVLYVSDNHSYADALLAETLEKLKLNPELRKKIKTGLMNLASSMHQQLKNCCDSKDNDGAIRIYSEANTLFGILNQEAIKRNLIPVIGYCVDKIHKLAVNEGKVNKAIKLFWELEQVLEIDEEKYLQIASILAEFKLADIKHHCESDNYKKAKKTFEESIGILKAGGKDQEAFTIVSNAAEKKMGEGSYEFFQESTDLVAILNKQEEYEIEESDTLDIDGEEETASTATKRQKNEPEPQPDPEIVKLNMPGDKDVRYKIFLNMGIQALQARRYEDAEHALYFASSYFPDQAKRDPNVWMAQGDLYSQRFLYDPKTRGHLGIGNKKLIPKAVTMFEHALTLGIANEEIVRKLQEALVCTYSQEESIEKYKAIMARIKTINRKMYALLERILPEIEPTPEPEPEPTPDPDEEKKNSTDKVLEKNEDFVRDCKMVMMWSAGDADILMENPAKRALEALGPTIRLIPHARYYGDFLGIVRRYFDEKFGGDKALGLINFMEFVSELSIDSKMILKTLINLNPDEEKAFDAYVKKAVNAIDGTGVEGDEFEEGGYYSKGIDSCGEAIKYLKDEPSLICYFVEMQKIKEAHRKLYESQWKMYFGQFIDRHKIDKRVIRATKPQKQEPPEEAQPPIDIDEAYAIPQKPGAQPVKKVLGRVGNALGGILGVARRQWRGENEYADLDTDTDPFDTDTGRYRPVKGDQVGDMLDDFADILDGELDGDDE